MNIGVTTEELASIGRDAEANTRRLKRRRTRTWLVFGLVGLMMGAVWAVGIASSSGAIGSSTAAAEVFGAAPGAEPTSGYAGLVTAETALTIGFSGSWGVVAADTGMFEVDLTLETAGTFFLGVFLDNNPTGWTALQLDFVQVNTACAAVDFSTPIDNSVMVIETEDAWAEFPSLAFGNTYCIGIAAATPKANDSAGTYIRRPGGGSPTAPNFVAVLNRSA